MQVAAAGLLAGMQHVWLPVQVDRPQLTPLGGPSTYRSGDVVTLISLAALAALMSVAPFPPVLLMPLLLLHPITRTNDPTNANGFMRMARI
jgi:hypothetical protein